MHFLLAKIEENQWKLKNNVFCGFKALYLNISINTNVLVVVPLLIAPLYGGVFLVFCNVFCNVLQLYFLYCCQLYLLYLVLYFVMLPAVFLELLPAVFLLQLWFKCVAHMLDSAQGAVMSKTQWVQISPNLLQIYIWQGALTNLERQAKMQSYIGKTGHLWMWTHTQTNCYIVFTLEPYWLPENM